MGIALVGIAPMGNPSEDTGAIIVLVDLTGYGFPPSLYAKFGDIYPKGSAATQLDICYHSARKT